MARSSARLGTCKPGREKKAALNKPEDETKNSDEWRGIVLKSLPPRELAKSAEFGSAELGKRLIFPRAAFRL